MKYHKKSFKILIASLLTVGLLTSLPTMEIVSVKASKKGQKRRNASQESTSVADEQRNSLSDSDSDSDSDSTDTDRNDGDQDTEKERQERLWEQFIGEQNKDKAQWFKTLPPLVLETWQKENVNVTFVEESAENDESFSEESPFYIREKTTPEGSDVIVTKDQRTFSREHTANFWEAMSEYTVEKRAKSDTLLTPALQDALNKIKEGTTQNDKRGQNLLFTKLFKEHKGRFEHDFLQAHISDVKEILKLALVYSSDPNQQSHLENYAKPIWKYVQGELSEESKKDEVTERQTDETNVQQKNEKEENTEIKKLSDQLHFLAKTANDSLKEIKQALERAKEDLQTAYKKLDSSERSTAAKQRLEIHIIDLEERLEKKQKEVAVLEAWISKTIAEKARDVNEKARKIGEENSRSDKDEQTVTADETNAQQESEEVEGRDNKEEPKLKRQNAQRKKRKDPVVTEETTEAGITAEQKDSLAVLEETAKKAEEEAEGETTALLKARELSEEAKFLARDAKQEFRQIKEELQQTREELKEAEDKGGLSGRLSAFNLKKKIKNMEEQLAKKQLEVDELGEKAREKQEIVVEKSKNAKAAKERARAAKEKIRAAKAQAAGEAEEQGEDRAATGK